MTNFLPVTMQELLETGVSQPDFVYITGDAYVDHPSFGAAIITRLLQSQGYSVAVLAQPDWHTVKDFTRFGKPRLAFLVTGGNIDSMVAHYTSAKRKRSTDMYSPGGRAGLRPDRAVITYCRKIREAYPDAAIAIGGLEASLRRFAHYDYWDDTVRPSILADSGADLLMYGMGEHQITELAQLLAEGVPIQEITDIRGTCYLTSPENTPWGGVPGIEEVQFSIAHNRGCFGYCNFCSIALHQGRRITCRSEESILEEAKKITEMPNFKGYIHDVGGPTANFRLPSCKKQAKSGMCVGKKCLAPEPCKALQVDHSEYLRILRKLRKLPKVKRVFIRSGIRFDYVMADKDDTFFKELVAEHVSGQLKVAPEHVSNVVLDKMGKPHIECYEAFQKRFYEITKSIGKKQYLVPYLMSSHPGSTLQEAVKLSLFLRDNGMHPEQVQDFYPTPGTISTCMYYTELDPYTMEPVYVPKTPKEKAMQRALLQYYLPQNRQLVLSALKQAGRQDLIGTKPNCLVAPEQRSDSQRSHADKNRNPHTKGGVSPRKPKHSSKKSRRS